MTTAMTYCLLMALTVLYSLNQGAMIFEHFTSDAIWASNPPDSFHIFNGPYGLETSHYWQVVTPAAAILFLVVIALLWNRPRPQKALLASFALFLLVVASTQLYFVPVQQGTIAAVGTVSSNVLKESADRWLLLNYLRGATGLIGFLFLLVAVRESKACS